MESKKISKQNENAKNLIEVEKIISNMNFGSITLVIQDGVIIQVEKMKRYDLSKDDMIYISNYYLR